MKDESGPAFPTEQPAIIISHDGSIPPTAVHGTEGLRGGLTARQYAAIHLKVPDSGLEWLDEMIRQSQMQEAHPLVRADMDLRVPAHWKETPAVAIHKAGEGKL